MFNQLLTSFKAQTKQFHIIRTILKWRFNKIDWTIVRWIGIHLGLCNGLIVLFYFIVTWLNVLSVYLKQKKTFEEEKKMPMQSYKLNTFFRFRFQFISLIRCIKFQRWQMPIEFFHLLEVNTLKMTHFIQQI